MMDEMMRQMIGGFGLLAMLLNLLITVGFLALVVWVVVRFSPTCGEGKTDSEQQTDSAQEILRERFARGEIDTEEYERSLNVLRGNSAQKSHEDSGR